MWLAHLGNDDRNCPSTSSSEGLERRRKTSSTGGKLTFKKECFPISGTCSVSFGQKTNSVTIRNLSIWERNLFNSEYGLRLCNPLREQSNLCALETPSRCQSCQCGTCEPLCWQATGHGIGSPTCTGEWSGWGPWSWCSYPQRWEMGRTPSQCLEQKLRTRK